MSNIFILYLITYNQIIRQSTAKYRKFVKFLLCIPFFILLGNDTVAQNVQNFSASGNYFIENKGQIIDQYGHANNDVLFILNSKGMNLHLKQNGFSYEIREYENHNYSNLDLYNEFIEKEDDSLVIKTHRVDIELTGSNPYPEVRGFEKSGGYFNYYLEGLTEEGIRNVSQYKIVLYKNIYDNIDLKFYLQNDNKDGKPVPSIKYDFIVHPGGKVSDIQMTIKGDNGIELSDERLIINTTLGNINEQIPVSYTKCPVGGLILDTVKAYFSADYNKIQFYTSNYDNTKTLIIDPEVIWSTYYGGSSEERAFKLAIDNQDNIYVTGYSRSNNNIATTGAHQTTQSGNLTTIIVMFNNAGHRQWGTYYGGNSWDSGYGIDIDKDNNIVTTGRSQSTGGIATTGAFLTSNPGSHSCFIAKFDTTGTRIWGTYYGGSGGDFCRDIVADNDTFIYIGGYTQSNSGIATSGTHLTSRAGTGASFDNMVIKFTTSGDRVWGSYFGGTSHDRTHNIGLYKDTTIFLSGMTESNSGIATSGTHQTSRAGSEDIHLTTFDTSGQRIWGTYYGGTGSEVSNALIVDGIGNAYITGRTNSSSGISTSGAHQTTIGGGWDVCIAKFNIHGILIWGSYYGGNNDERAREIDAIRDTSIIITGFTRSSNNIASSGAFQTSISGTQDAYFAIFDSSGNKKIATYYGSNGIDDGFDVKFNTLNEIILVGETNSSSGISTSGAHQTSYGGDGDGFVTKFGFSPKISVTDTFLCPSYTFIDSTLLSIDNPSEFSGFQWLLNNDTIPNANDTIYYAYSTGEYKLIAKFSSSQVTVISNIINIHKADSFTVDAGDDKNICLSDSAFITSTVSPSGSYTYQWTPNYKLNSNTLPNIFADPDTTTIYTLLVTDTNNCKNSDSVTVYVHIAPNPYSGPDTIETCYTVPVELIADSAYSYKWIHNPDTAFSNTTSQITYFSPHISANYSNTIHYNIQLATGNIYGCSDTAYIVIKSFPASPLQSPEIKCIKTNSDSSVTIMWEPIPFNSNHTGYNIFRKSPEQSEFVIVDSSLNDTATQWTDNNTKGSDSLQYLYYITSAGTCNSYGTPGDTIGNIPLTFTYTNSVSGILKWEKINNDSLSYTISVNDGNGFTVIDSTWSDSFYFKSDWCEYNLSFRINQGSCSHSNEINLYFIDTISPEYPNEVLTTINNNQKVELLISIQNKAQFYRILRSVNGDSYTIYDSVSVDSQYSYLTYLDENVTFPSNTYCYRIQTIDSCGNIGLAGSPHCPVTLNGTAGNLNNLLFWENYIGTTIDTVFVERLINDLWVAVAELKPSDSNFIDTTDIECNVPVSYRIRSLPDSTNSLNFSGSGTENIAPEATVTGSDCRSAPCSGLNNENFGNCGTQEVWISTSSPPSSTEGVDWIQWDWNSPQSFNEIIIHYGFNNTRHLTGGKIQIWNGNSWVTMHTFSNLVTTTGICDAKITFPPITAERMRITSFEMTGPSQKLNPSFREIEIMGTFSNSYSNIITLTPFDSIPPTPPEIYFSSVTPNNSIEIQWDSSLSNNVDRYVVYRKSFNGNFVAIDTVGKTGFYIDSSVDPSLEQYCYAVAALDSCSHNLSELSQSHCVIFLDGKTSNLANILTWTQHTGLILTDFDLIEITGSDTILISNITDTNYIDDRPCNVPVTYLVIGNTNDNSITYSNQISLTPFDTIPPVPPAAISATVTGDNEVIVTWNKSPSNDVDRYVIYRKIKGSFFSVIDTVGDVYLYTDTSVNPDSLNQYCYAIAALDSCADNISELSQTHCLILLNTSIVTCEQKILLNWTSYSGWDSIALYRIFKQTNTDSFELIAEVNDTTFAHTDTNTEFPNSYCYFIEAVSANNSNITSVSNFKCNAPFHPQTPYIQYVSKLNSDPDTGRVIIMREQQNFPFIQYSTLYYKTPDDTGFSILKDSIPPDQTTFYHTNLNNKEQDHIYFFTNTDSCGNLSFPSDTHKTMTITVHVGQLLHIVDWTPYIGFNVIYYLLERLDGQEFYTYDTLAPTDTNFYYTPAPCNFPIIYRITAVSDEGYFSRSDTAGRVAIDTIPPDAPIIHNLSISDGQMATLDFTGADSLDVYGFDIRRLSQENETSAGFFFFNEPSEYLTFEDTSLSFTSQNCYVVVSLDSCLNATPSDTFCHIKIQGIEQNLQNTLHWNPFKGYSIDYYYIERLTDNVWTLLDSVSGTDTSYIHTDIPCNFPQTYRIRGLNTSDMIYTYSDYISLTPFDTTSPLPPVLDYISIKDHTSLELQWQFSDPKVTLYEIQIKTPNNDWLIVDTTGVTVNHTVSGLNTKDSVYCVRIVAIDSCAANRSEPSVSHCAVNLSGEPANLANQLNWTKYTGFDTLEYYVQVLNEGIWLNTDTLHHNINFYTHQPLPCNIPFTYRIAAVSPDFVSYSDSLSLIPYDSIPPPPPLMDYVSVLDYNNIELQWQLSDPKVKLYEIQIKTQNSNWEVIDTTGVVTNHIISGLNTNDSVYCFRVVAIDSCASNRSEPSVSHCAINLIGNPGNLSNQLYWTNYQGFDTLEYYIQHLSNSVWQNIDTVSGNITSYFHHPLSCNIPITYRISAISPQFISYSDTITLIPFDTIPPDPPQIEYATVVDNERIEIKWNVQPQSDAKYFEVWKKDEFGNFSVIDTFTYIYEYIDWNVSPVDNPYSYYIISVDSCSNNNRSEPTQIHTSITQELSTGACEPLINLKWTHYQGYDNFIYVIHRAVNDSNNYNSFYSTHSGIDSYIDSGVIEDNFYCYIIEAFDTLNNYRSFSAMKCINPFVFPQPDTAQAIRTSVTQTGSINGTIQIDWNRADPDDIYARGYYIYHKNPGTDWNLIHTVMSLNDTSYLHSNVNTVDSLNHYMLTNFNLCDVESEPSVTHIPVKLDLTNNNLEIILDWTNYLGFEVMNFAVYRSVDNGTYKRITTLPPNRFSFNDTDIQCFINYSYKIFTESNQQISSWSNEVFAEAYDTIPPQRAGLFLGTVTNSHTSEGSVDLSFYPSKDKNRSGYQLYRSINGQAFTLHQTIHTDNNESITLTDQDINVMEDIHSYYIVSFDSCGNYAAPSDTHSVVKLETNSGDRVNLLQWTQYAGWNNWFYRIDKWSASTGWNSIDTLPSNITDYEDINVRCDTSYTYRIVVLNSDTSVVSYSNQSTIKNISLYTPYQPVKNNVTVLQTGITDGIIDINWFNDTTGLIFYYKLERSVNNINWITIEEEIHDTTFRDEGLNTEHIAYYYRIWSSDSCFNISELPSYEHRSILLNTTPGEENATLLWSHYKGWKPDIYRIERDGSFITYVAAEDSVYTDNELICTHEYTYRVMALRNIVNGDTQYAFSNTSFVTPHDTTPPERNYLITASVTEPNTETFIEWEPSSSQDAAVYHLLRRKSGTQEYNRIFSTSNSAETSYLDINDIEGSRWCYSVLVEDHCGNTSFASNEGCIMIPEVLAEQLINKLKCEPYLEWRQNIERYLIYRKQDDGIYELIAVVPGRDSTVIWYDEKLGDFVENYCYRVEAVEVGGVTSMSAETCVQQAAWTFLPTAFSPGVTPGINDTFGPVGMYINSFEMSIYNRWGQLVYETMDSEFWNGQDGSGNYVIDGVYLYMITIEGFNGEEIKLHGSLTVLR